MQTYKTRTVQKEEKYDYKEFCDWCGNEIKSTDSYDADEFDLSWRTGSAYPDSSNTETQTVDLCIPCRERLFAYLKENGCKVQVIDTSY